MQIIIAEQGREVGLDSKFNDIYQQGNLSLALQSLTGVGLAAQLIYVKGGGQLREDNAEDLLAKSDLTLYVFNRDLLGAGSHTPVELLLPEDSQWPQIGDLMHDAETCVESIHDLESTISMQHDALLTVLSDLERHTMSFTEAFDVFRNVAQRELDRQHALLQGHELDLEIISKIKIHPEFLSPNARRGIGSTGRERTLGEYVSGPKMKMVAGSCIKLHDELLARYSHVADCFNKLIAGVGDIKLELENAPFRNQVASYVGQADDYLTDLRNGNLETDVKKSLLQAYQGTCKTKNKSTEHIFSFLAKVSDVEHIMSQISEELGTLETDFRRKGGFPHLQRLRDMLYTYGVTVVEIVRRREFNRFFMDKAQATAELLAKLSAHERKRRQVYRSDARGQLPFDIQGMDEPAPTLEISTSGGGEITASLDRQDIVAFLDLVSQIENTPSSALLPNTPHPASEARLAFERLVSKLDSLESDFDRLAERAVLSASRIYQSRKQSTSDASCLQEVVEQLRDAQAAKVQQDITFQRETAALNNEVDRLRVEIASASTSKTRAERLEIELDVTRAKYKSEAVVRKDLEQKLKESEAALSALRRDMDLEAQKDQTNSRIIRRLEELETERIESLLVSQQLQERNKKLEEELRQALDERDTLNDVIHERDVQLREQSSAAERSLRDHIAETDGDRAVLEQQVAELRQALEGVSQGASSAERLQAEVARLELENNELKTKLNDSQDTVVQLASAARKLYDSHSRAHKTAHNVLKASKVATNGTDTNVIQPPEASSPPTVMVEPPEALPEFDLAKPQPMLNVLSAVNLQALDEAVIKIGSNSRKYLKLSKEYRERSKSKITFRNFGRGDLALFLPTRNSVAKPWAAFNVAFPHYFLNATEDIGELLKSREWIVARILSITERIADSKQPNGNPFGLGDGVKFFLLDVEDWTQPSNVVKRRTVSSTIRPLSITSHEARERISSWSETTALATALPSSDPDVDDALGIEGLPSLRSGIRTMPPSAGAQYFNKLSVSPSAGPSSLSRVLAQAPTPISPRPRSAVSSPRNAERSRSRTTSLSSARPPHMNSPNKAVATTALSELPVPITNPGTPEGTTPSPSGSAFDGMGSVVLSRRRPTSITPGMSAGSTLASIASNWRLPIGRRRNQAPTRASPAPSEIE